MIPILSGIIVGQKGDKYHLDIYPVARIILNDLGVDAITGGDQCTVEQDKTYFSYRRDGANYVHQRP
jgi:copper oxidase (laccase) domain-containing protein